VAAHAPLTVAAAQVAAVPGDVAANLRKHLEVIEAARSAGADLLLFPELSLTGHGGGAAALQVALGAGSDVVKTLACATGPMCTTFGLVEEGPGAQFYNAAMTVRDGALIHVHRKVNLATYGRLDDGRHFRAGRRVEPFAFDGPWTASCLICADTWNPALVHLAALQAATLLLVPVSSAREAVADTFDNPAGWEINCAFHALTYGLPLVMANRVGTEADLTFWGGSRVLDAHGRIVAKAGDTETLLTAQLDYDDVRTARYRLPTVRDANLPVVRAEMERIAREHTRKAD
jgi:predicted amidohydrolase